VIKKSLKFCLGILLTLIFSACSDDDNGSENIMQVAQSAESLSTLLTVIEFIDANGSQENITDLSALLSTELGGTEFTVFAPSNEAFNDLDQNMDGTFDGDDVTALSAALGGAQNLADALYLVVSNHVLAGKVESSGLSDGLDIVTLAETTTENSANFGLTAAVGSNFVITPSYTPFAGTVLSVDNQASNGVVHIVNKVLLDDVTAAALGLAAD